ncbi:hypothetical protein SAMN04487783_0918 [Agrococcus baldri]|uniref:Uncharacterized protein n=1 Tax=Agrococcus baldri TaxID=153730 RepID=A0AA94HLI8_9MICO|nr:hypothetical protein [Agrococcus baldri]SFS07148.1 hypothetical protein SAMN04487783_0918 [Agrococcus baldri]
MGASGDRGRGGALRATVARDDLRGAALGAAAGLAWIGALRVWMALLAGSESTVTWRTGPFVLLPGAIVGAAHGLGASRRSHRELVPMAVRWSPIAFAAPLLLPGAMPKLLHSGIGSGALMPLTAMAVSGAVLRPAFAHDRPRVRQGAAVVAALAIVGGMVGGATTRALAQPLRGALVGLLGTSLLVLAGVAAPLAYDRAVVTPR